VLATRRAASLFETLFRRREVEEELDAELRSCFDLLVERHLERGLAIEEAKRRARLEFGGLEQVKDRVREARLGTAVESVPRDVRYACRALRRSPGFTVITALTLALGIGVNAAIFSVVHAVLMRPLPYDRPERLALIWSTLEKMGTTRAPTSGPALGEIGRRSRLLEDVAGIWVGTGTFTGDADPEQVKVGFVTPSFLQLLGVRPALGRLFTADERPGGRPALVLSDGLWRRRFGGDPGIVGKGVSFLGASATVVGVMPQGFRLYFPADANVADAVEAFAPFRNDVYKLPPAQYFIRVLARLKPGVTLGQAQADLDAVAAAIRGAYSELASENMQLALAPLQRDAVREVRPALMALFTGSGFVLLICCVNVTSLLLARATDRRKEIAVRSALGATRGRILRQLLLEGLLLCALAGAAGLALGWAGVRGLAGIRPAELARIGDLGLSWQALGFVAAVSLAVATSFGLTPSLLSPGPELAGPLQKTSRASSPPAMRGMRAALIVGEIAFGCVLVVGAGLMIRTLSKIREVRPGFEPRRLLTFEIDLSRLASPAAVELAASYEAKIAALPGVEAVGAVSHLPLDDYPNWYSPYRPLGVAEKDAASLLADYRSATPGYLPAMGTRLLAGRYFDERDRAGGNQVVIVDEMLARSAWPGSSAVGKKIATEHFTPDGIRPVWSEVVGVVEHVRNHSLAKKLRGEIYLPFAQSPREHLSFAVRTRLEPLALAGPIRRGLHQRDKELALSKVRPMTAYVAQATAPVSFTAALACIFGGLALLLAATGIYGVTSYAVSTRMHEMGIRMALGATSADVVRLVMREGLALTAMGMAIGVAGALFVSRALQSLIYGISALDPVTYGAAIVVIPAAALIGCWWPASRAAAANPVDAIRAETCQGS
jgi:putative ABC transport system permease protein